jgi:hypothetical protein
MLNNHFRNILAAGVFALLAAGTGPFGGGLDAQGQAPGLRIDFQVVTGDGRPVTNLEPGDVTIRIAGKPRDVRSLDLVELAGGDPAPAGPARPPFATNVAAAGGRTLLLVVDDDSVELGREQGLKRSLTTILQGLSPLAGDRVGLVSTRTTGGVNIAPTTDHAAVQQAIDGFRGYSGTESRQDYQCRTLETLRRLESAIASATGETPTTVAFFSAAMMQPSGEAAKMLTKDYAEGRDVPSDLCQPPTPRHFEAVGTALAGSRAHVYVAHVAEGTTRSQTEAAFGVESLAGVVGGDTLRLTGDGEVVAQRIVAETAAYYVATVSADPSDKGTTPQRMEVRVNREGVQVRARANITPSRLAGATPSGRVTKTSPRDMIRTADEFRDLPLRAAAYESRNPDDNIRFVVLFEPDGEPAKITSAMIGLYTPEGKLVAQWSSQDPDLASMPVRAALVVPEGEYRLRVAAVDSKGRSGSLDQQVRASLETAGSISMSAPLLGPVPASGGFAPKLLFTGADDAVVSYVELYSVPAGANVTATLELARSEDAPALGTTDAQVRPGANNAATVIGGFSIDTLEPGDYVVRTVISLDGKPIGHAVSTMRKTGT